MPNIAKPNKTKKTKIHKVIFVDRDGVVNRDNLNGYITRWRDFHFVTGVFGAFRMLRRAGYRIIIISNQAGVGDGVYPKKALDLITKKMRRAMRRKGVAIRAIYYCLHGKKAKCSCRKPKTGLFRKASKKIRFKRTATFFIGDKLSDVLAGKRFKLKTAFVLTGHGRNHLAKLKKNGVRPDLIAPNVVKAVDGILQLNKT